MRAVLAHQTLLFLARQTFFRLWWDRHSCLSCPSQLIRLIACVFANQTLPRADSEPYDSFCVSALAINSSPRIPIPSFPYSAGFFVLHDKSIVATIFVEAHMEARTGRQIKIDGMTYAPTNEQGVVFLFGRLAPRLGFCVEHVQTRCPDEWAQFVNELQAPEKLDSLRQCVTRGTPSAKPLGTRQWSRNQT